MTKLYFVRHGQTNFNLEGWSDELGEAHLTEQGEKEAKVLADKLLKLIFLPQTVIYCSPIPRTFMTIKPYLLTQLPQADVEELEKKHNQCYSKYQRLVNNNLLFNYIHSTKSSEPLTRKLNEKVIVDFRLTERFSTKDFHKTIMKEGINYFPSWSYESQRGKQGQSEGSLHIRDRIHGFLKEIKIQNYTNIICVGHAGSGRILRKYFEDFNFNTQREDFRIKNTEIFTFYL